VLKIPHSILFLILRFLLRNLLLPYGFTFLCHLFSSLTAFNILSLLFVLVVLMIICHEMFNLVKSVCCPGDFLYLSGKLFLQVWEILSYYFVEYIMYPLSLHLFSFSMTVIHRLVFWWSHWILAYPFCSPWVICLQIVLSFL
jgi:hypothetical protein